MTRPPSSVRMAGRWVNANVNELVSMRIPFGASGTDGASRMFQRYWFTGHENDSIESRPPLGTVASAIGIPRAARGRYSGSVMSATVASRAAMSASASTKRLRPCSPAPIETRRPVMVSSATTGQAVVEPRGVMVPRS